MRPFVLSLGLFMIAGCAANSSPPTGSAPTESSAGASEKSPMTIASSTADPALVKTELATLGAGCFWCVEAVFQQLDGVLSVESGFTGGQTLNPTYQDICEGDTGHAEVCHITFNPSKISFDELLEVFWQTHDPTTLNRQGADAGTQYRSAIFFHNEEQRTTAEKYKRKLDASGAFPAPIVTEIAPFTKFYKADNFHQNYFLDNPNQGYCRAIIQPKVDKFRKAFADKLKASSK